MQIAIHVISSNQPSLPPISMPSLLFAQLSGTSEGCFALLGMIEGPFMIELEIHAFPELDSSHVHSSTAKRFPKLRSLELTGRFGNGILAAFPTVTRLGINDFERRPQDNIINLDPNQDGLQTCCLDWNGLLLLPNTRRLSWLLVKLAGPKG